MNAEISELIKQLTQVFVFIIESIDRFMRVVVGGSILSYLFGAVLTYGIVKLMLSKTNGLDRNANRVLGKTYFWIITFVVTRLLNSISVWVLDLLI